MIQLKGGDKSCRVAGVRNWVLGDARVRTNPREAVSVVRPSVSGARMPH